MACTRLAAKGGRLVAVELQPGLRQQVARRADGLHGFVHEQQHRRDEGRQAPRKFGGALGRHVARALRIEHEADRIRAGFDCGVDVLLTADAADLDPGPAHGNQSYAATWPGKPQWSSYTGPRKYRPSGEKVGDAASRLRASSTSRIHAGGCSPWPTATRQPMRFRIMWCRKAFAWKSKRQYGPRRWMVMGSSVFTGVGDWQDEARKEVKSCVPTRW